MSKMKEIKFNEMFDLRRGKVLSKKYLHEHKGDYPVYSTQVNEIFGSIDSYMLDGKYLLWNTDGLAGYIRVVNGKFSYTNIVGVMLFKEDFDPQHISLEYLRIFLEPIFRRNIKGRIGENGKNEYTKLNSTMIKNLDIKINLPINHSSQIDLDAQLEVVRKHLIIEEKRKQLLKKKNEIESLNIKFENTSKTTDMQIKTICDKCNSDKTITKEKLKNHSRKYPVYAGSIGKPLCFAETFNNEDTALLVVNDGDAGKTYIVRDKKYSIGKHVTGLKLKSDYSELIDLEYLQIVSEPIFINKNKSQGRGNLPQTDILRTFVPIPINSDGSMNHSIQSEIARKKKKVDSIKENISKLILELVTQVSHYLKPLKIKA